MNSVETFSAFFDSIAMESAQEYEDSLQGVAKKLNEKYYGSSSTAEHLILVGSVGRGTAVDGTSDVDVLFELPWSVKIRFDGHEGNGQSDLLQEVRNVLLERYPRTKIKGDGQAVVIEFTDRNYTIDLVPAFRRVDDSFDYPDTNNGGSWKKTDPFPEQEACNQANGDSNGAFQRYCNVVRVWKESTGAKIGGLLVDTLIERYIRDNDDLMAGLIGESYECLQRVFELLSKEDPEQSYWLALGSNQQIYNKDHGSFVKKAKIAFKKMEAARSTADMEDVLIELFGKRFKDCIVDSALSRSESFWSRTFSYVPREEFIEDQFPILISESLSIDCEVTQNGFRPFLLSAALRQKTLLKRDKGLRFFISSTSAREPFDVLWKVRNCGEAAYRKKMVRGTILEDGGRRERHEHTDFTGNHYVECYLIRNDVCIARDRIDVPIRIEG